MKPKADKSEFTARYTQSIYFQIAKKIKIESITEGRLMRETIQEILAGKDIMKLKDKSVRIRKRQAIKEVAMRYAKRAKKFWTVFQTFNYYMGKIKAFEDLLKIKKSNYLLSGKKYYEKKLKELFA